MSLLITCAIVPGVVEAPVPSGSNRCCTTAERGLPPQNLSASANPLVVHPGNKAVKAERRTSSDRLFDTSAHRVLMYST